MELSMIIVAISLSMDAFSLALAYGTLDFPVSFSRVVSMTVGTFHFIMPILGMSVKNFLVGYSNISFDVVTFIVYLYLGVMLLLELKNERKITPLTSFKDTIFFSLAVSLDSFSIGIALPVFSILAPIIFAIFSCFFTYLGFKIGKNLYHYLGKISIFIGGIFFLLLAFFHL